MPVAVGKATLEADASLDELTEVEASVELAVLDSVTLCANADSRETSVMTQIKKMAHPIPARQKYASFVFLLSRA